MTIDKLKAIFEENGFHSEDTWGVLLMRKDDRSLFLGDDHFFTLSTYEGKGNGNTGWLHGRLSEVTEKAMRGAIHKSNNRLGENYG